MSATQTGQSTSPLHLVLPWPPSVNHYWRHARGRTYVSDEGRAYREAVRRHSGATSRPIITDRLEVRVDAHPPDRRKRDLDNLGKALLDALTACGVWCDDSQIDDLRIVRGPVVSGGSVTVTITVLSPARAG